MMVALMDAASVAQGRSSVKVDCNCGCAPRDTFRQAAEADQRRAAALVPNEAVWRTKGRVSWDAKTTQARRLAPSVTADGIAHGHRPSDGASRLPVRGSLPSSATS